MLPAKSAIDTGHCALLEPLAVSLADFCESFGVRRIDPGRIGVARPIRRTRPVSGHEWSPAPSVDETRGMGQTVVEPIGPAWRGARTFVPKGSSS